MKAVAVQERVDRWCAEAAVVGHQRIWCSGGIGMYEQRAVEVQEKVTADPSQCGKMMERDDLKIMSSC